MEEDSFIEIELLFVGFKSLTFEFEFEDEFVEFICVEVIVELFESLEVDEFFCLIDLFFLIDFDLFDLLFFEVDLLFSSVMVIE